MKYPVKARAEEKEEFEPIPKGDYWLQCVEFREKVAKSGNPLISVAFKVVDQGDYFGRTIWHNLTIIQSGNPGHGLMVHFLKQIGQPYDGDILIDPENFLGEKIKALVVIEEYQGRNKNAIKEIHSLRETTINAKEHDDIPF